MIGTAVPDIYINALPGAYAQPQPVPLAVPPLRIGAIRYDAWDDPVSDLTRDEAAALSPEQYRARAPFWATVGDGVALPALTQGRMDAEIAQALAARLDYFAFVGFNDDDPASTALHAFRASGARAGMGFCMIETMQSLYYLGTFLPNVARTVALMADPGHVRVMDGRPLLFVLSMSTALMVERFGSVGTLQLVLDGIRERAIAAGVGNPYIVVMDGWAPRAVRLAALGADAAGAYVAPGEFVGARPYGQLTASVRAWREEAARGARIVPPMMAGWDFRPRITTPSPFWSSAGSLADYYQMPTAPELTVHAAEVRDWIAANPNACPAQTGLLYAWNEFTEGGFVCPTYLSGQPAGDTSRIAALAAALGE